MTRGHTVRQRMRRRQRRLQEVRRRRAARVTVPRLARARNRVNFNDTACIAIFPNQCTDFTETETGFAGAFGGGLDIRAGDRIDVRVIQFDYNPTRLFDSTQHNFRIGVGIVFH